MQAEIAAKDDTISIFETVVSRVAAVVTLK